MTTPPTVKPEPQRAFVFVGGPADGTVKSVELGPMGMPPQFQTVLLDTVPDRPFRIYDKVDDDPFRKVVMFRTYEYRLRYMADSDGRHLGMYVGSDVIDPLVRLLSNYRPGVPPRADRG